MVRLARVLFVAGCLLPCLAHAQSGTPGYPARPVRIIVPFATGGATDYIARFMAEQLGRRLGQPFVVENRTGAGGIIGIDAVVKSPADGHTLLVASASYAVNPAVMKLPFDPVRDVTPVVNMVFGPLALMVHPDLPVRTLADFVNYVQARPGQLTYASAGIGNTTHIAMEAFLADTRTQMVHSPYKGMAPALADVAGGHVKVIMSDVGSALPLMNAGRLRMLAIGGMRRFMAFPDVPTVAESGFPNLLAGSWQGMFAPRGAPAAVVAELNKQVNDVLGQKDLADTLASRFLTPIGGSVADFAATVRADIDRFAVVARHAGLKPE